jgi:hypothetical protein
MIRSARTIRYSLLAIRCFHRIAQTLATMPIDRRSAALISITQSGLDTQVPDKVRIGAELRHQLERAPVVLKHEAEISGAEAPRIAEKVLENRLQLAG